MIDATLASAQKRLESGEILPSRVLDLARWAVEMKEGKATVRLDSQSQVTLKHDPSLMIQALKELQAVESQWRLAPQLDITVGKPADLLPTEAPETPALCPQVDINDGNERDSLPTSDKCASAKWVEGTQDGS